MKYRMLRPGQISKAAIMWGNGKFTMQIAQALKVPESKVYNTLDYVKSRNRYNERAK